MNSVRNRKIQRPTYAEWAVKVIQLFQMAGYDYHTAWANRLPALYDEGATPSDAVRFILQGIGTPASKARAA